jgi:hypothetical protein
MNTGKEQWFELTPGIVAKTAIKMTAVFNQQIVTARTLPCNIAGVLDYEDSGVASQVATQESSRVTNIANEEVFIVSLTLVGWKFISLSLFFCWLSIEG